MNQKIPKPFYLGEASYLVNELKHYNITANIESPKDKSKYKKEKHYLVVDEKNFGLAVTIVENSLNKDTPQTKTNTKKGKLKKAILAGFFGGFIGARLGTKIKSPAYYMLCIFGCAFFSFATAYFLQD